MLFGSESISAYSRPNVVIWMILALQAGLLNIGGLLACHSFVSHVTGYATLFGRELYRANLWAASGMLLVPGAFLLGAMLSGFLVDVQLQQRRKPRYYIVFGVLFLLLLFVVIGGFNGFFGTFGEPLESTGDYTLLVVLCLVCGIQNGTITVVSKSVVRTTHLTGITTDLGIGLARLLNRKNLAHQIHGEGRANLVRVGIILSFGFGSVVGAWLFSGFAYRGFLFPMGISGLLFLVSFYLQVLRT